MSVTWSSPPLGRSDQRGLIRSNEAGIARRHPHLPAPTVEPLVPEEARRDVGWVGRSEPGAWRYDPYHGVPPERADHRLEEPNDRTVPPNDRTGNGAGRETWLEGWSWGLLEEPNDRTVPPNDRTGNGAGPCDSATPSVKGDRRGGRLKFITTVTQCITWCYDILHCRAAHRDDRHPRHACGARRSAREGGGGLRRGNGLPRSASFAAWTRLRPP